MRALFGAIAQLGERVNGIHEVGSSILPGSTIFPKHLIFLSRVCLSRRATLPRDNFFATGQVCMPKIDEIEPASDYHERPDKRLLAIG